MSAKIRETVQALLAEGKIKGFLGLKKENGHIAPHLFCDPKELDSLSLGDGGSPGMPGIPQSNPDPVGRRISRGVVCRACPWM